MWLPDQAVNQAEGKEDRGEVESSWIHMSEVHVQLQGE